MSAEAVGPAPVYADDLVRLYAGDCRELTAVWAVWGDVLVTDPPYGFGYDRRRGTWQMPAGRPHAIAGDRDTGLRDEVLALWGDRPAMVFGVFGVAEPAGTVQRLIYRKPPDAGTHGTHAGFRHDVELVYLVGKWPAALGGRSSVLETRARMAGGALGMAGRYGHPHAKPADVMEQLIAACPAGVIVDPFAGSGSTLIAARHLGREAIGVEVEPLYAEAAARRLAQGVLA